MIRASRLSTAALPALLLVLPGSAHAHSFGRSYNLPVPVWLYAWGAAAALLLSFLLIAWFFGASHSTKPAAGRVLPSAWLRPALPLLRGLGLLLLLLCIASGFWGSADAYRNFNMTWFWIVFVLGLAYATALLGDFYAYINPWATLARALRLGQGQGRLPYPPWLGYWPALALYMGFIWVELFGRTLPHSLAWLLLAYTAINLAGSWLFGAASWFRYGEFFAVFLRLLGLMAPLHYTDGQLRLRLPFAGLLSARAEHPSLLLFVLFMLSSTAFDGLHATEPGLRCSGANRWPGCASWRGITPPRPTPSCAVFTWALKP